MWSFLILAPAPSLNDDLGFDSGPEPFEIKALVSELPVEPIVRTFLPRLPRGDEYRVDLILGEPADHGRRDKLRPFVRSDMPRGTVQAHQPTEFLHDLLGANLAINEDREAL